MHDVSGYLRKDYLMEALTYTKIKLSWFLQLFTDLSLPFPCSPDTHYPSIN